MIFFTRQLIPGFHAQIVELFRRVGAFPKVAQHAVHLQTIVGLVASGVGIAILLPPPSVLAEKAWSTVP